MMLHGVAEGRVGRLVSRRRSGFFPMWRLNSVVEASYESSLGLTYYSGSVVLTLVDTPKNKTPTVTIAEGDLTWWRRKLFML